MVFYFLQSDSSKLELFHSYKRTIQLKNSSNEIRAIMRQMLEEAGHRPSVEQLVEQFPDHFSSAVISWQMECDIATKILAYELEADRLSYLWELVSYFFYYLLLPARFRRTFFLLHGMTVKTKALKIEDFVKPGKLTNYVIFKGGQELLSTLSCQTEDLKKEGATLIEDSKRNYQIYSGEQSNWNGTTFLQIKREEI